MNHICPSKSPLVPCRFNLDSSYCYKVVKCPCCGKKVNPYMMCEQKCLEFKPKVWWFDVVWVFGEVREPLRYSVTKDEFMKGNCK